MKENPPRKPWSRKTWKIIALVLMPIVGLNIALALVYAGVYIYDRQFYIHDWGCNDEVQTTKSGSWENINQTVEKPADWQPFVGHSAFIGTSYPIIDGSTTMVPLAMEFARQHWGYDVDAEQFAQFSTTGVAYERLFNGEIDLFIGTRPGKEELALAKQNGITPVMKPICWDSFVFITHKENPVSDLTVEQLRGVFSGEITNWSALGGPDKPIRLLRREPGAGSQTGMETLIMQGSAMAEHAEIITGMGALVEAAADRNDGAYGIGYTYSYYIENLYKSADIQMIAIDGVAPSNENVISGAYSLRLERFAVIRKGDELAPGGRFLDWILSPEGQACVKQAGYIPLKEAAS